MPTQVVHSAGGTAAFTYDGEGRRVKKAVSGGSTTCYISEDYEVIDASAVTYVFAGTLRIAKVTATGALYFHKDHLGSSTVMSDGTGIGSVETTEYLPFGSMRAHTGSALTAYKYTDQELDAETGLYNYDARLYDPVIGRFISPDTVIPDPYNPQSLNRYSYCLNNPLIYVDPNGHFEMGALSIGEGLGEAMAASVAEAFGGGIRNSGLTGQSWSSLSVASVFGWSNVFNGYDSIEDEIEGFDVPHVYGVNEKNIAKLSIEYTSSIAALLLGYTTKQSQLIAGGILLGERAFLDTCVVLAGGDLSEEPSGWGIVSEIAQGIIDNMSEESNTSMNIRDSILQGVYDDIANRRAKRDKKSVP